MQALDAGKTAQSKRVYFDFADMLRTNPTGNVPYTPTLSLLYGMRKSIGLLQDEGIDKVWKRHYRWVIVSSFSCVSLHQPVLWGSITLGPQPHHTHKVPCILA